MVNKHMSEATKKRFKSHERYRESIDSDSIGWT